MARYVAEAVTEHAPRVLTYVLPPRRVRMSGEIDLPSGGGFLNVVTDWLCNGCW